MAQSKSTTVGRSMNTLIPASRIRALSVETGAVKRKRKIDIVKLVWTLVLGFATGGKRSIAGLRRAFEIATEMAIVPSAFYDRFNRGLVKLLKALVAEVLDKLVPAAVAKDGNFREVLTVDSTVIRLHDLLEKPYPACRTNHTKAAAKAHVILNVIGRGLHSIKLTCERVHDGPVLRAGGWVRGKLLIFDLGYYRFQLFARIDACAGFFLTRLKEGANPIITAVHVGSGAMLVGQKLQDVLGSLKRPVIDFEVEVSFSRREYGGSRSRAKARFRLAGIRNTETGRYHLYLTNIPVGKLDAEELAKLYEVRWVVELLFRELKGSYRLEDLPSSKRNVVECLIYATILSLAASRALYRAVAARMKAEASRMPEERWGIVFASVALDILKIIIGRREVREAMSSQVLWYLQHEAIDPNVGRSLLLARTRQASACEALGRAA
jgi:putative transposase